MELRVLKRKWGWMRDSRDERRASTSNLLARSLLHLDTGAQLQSGVLQSVAKGLVRSDAQTCHEGDDEAAGQRSPHLPRIEAFRDDSNNSDYGCGEKRSEGCREEQDACVHEKDEVVESDQW